MSALDDLLEYLKDWIIPRVDDPNISVPLVEGVQSAAAELARLRSQLASVQAERDAMRALFNLYGSHHSHCQNQFARKCECGFNEERQRLTDEARALAAATAEQSAQRTTLPGEVISDFTSEADFRIESDGE